MTANRCKDCGHGKAGHISALGMYCWVDGCPCRAFVPDDKPATATPAPMPPAPPRDPEFCPRVQCQGSAKRLRGELATLRVAHGVALSDLEQAHASLREMGARNTMLRAERDEAIKRATAYRDQVVPLRDEVEALRAELDACITGRAEATMRASEMLDALRAERDELRAALERIADLDYPITQNARGVARAALTKGSNDE